jgi:glc operon protein GlcG
MSSMTLREAIAYVDRGMAKANELALKLSFVVVDEFGQLVQLDRMDGAALMSLPTSQVAKIDREALNAMEQVVHFKIFALAGGVPIFAGTELKGAIGVSGATPQQEEEVANYAIR